MKINGSQLLFACNAFVISFVPDKNCLYTYWSKDPGSVLHKRVDQKTTIKLDSSTQHRRWSRRTEKLRIFLRPLAVKPKHLFLLTNSKWHPAVIFLNLSMWKRSKTHFVAERNSSVLWSAMLDRRVTELTNHKEACSIWAGLAVIGQKIQWVDQWSSRGVGQGARAHKTAGNRA